MDDAALLRYSRHILLNEIGVEGQEHIGQARVLVVGAGGLGAAACLYLAGAGVGKLLIADGDQVDLTNLQRQVIHREAAVGLNKAQSAAQTLIELNAMLDVETICSRLDEASLRTHVANVDIVLDCTDNFATRHAINRCCVALGKPLVSGAAIRFDGQLTAFDARIDGAPCYQCLFPENADAEEERCAVMGVFAPLVGIIGAAQAAEALRMIIGVGEPLVGRLSMLDARSMKWREVKYRRDPACTVCGVGATMDLEEQDHEMPSSA